METRRHMFSRVRGRTQAEFKRGAYPCLALLPSMLHPLTPDPSHCRQAGKMSIRRITKLYHLAEATNLPSILRHGLLSTERLLALAGVGDEERAEIVRRHRPDCVTLVNGVVIRDQKPMPPNMLAPALADGLQPSEWYALLNQFVFLWPSRERLERQKRAYRPRPQIVLVFDAQLLLSDVGDRALVSPINSGNARRRAARRGPKTLIPYPEWKANGWGPYDETAERRRPKSHAPAEILVYEHVPTTEAHLVAVLH